MDAILEQFLTEARENLEYLDKHLEELEEKDDEVVNALFRAAHTLKGGAGLVGLNSIKEITHAAEDLLDAYRKGEIDFSEELLETLYDAFDEVVEIVDAVEEVGSVDVEIDEKKIESIKNEIRSFLNQEEKEEVAFPFEIDYDLNLAQYFTPLQISKIASIHPPIKTPQIENAKADYLFLMEMDLDTDTLKLGNDPIYLFSLLGENKIKAVSVRVNCEEIKEDLLSWESYIVACINSNAVEIEDVFYNILDELRFTPLSIEKLLESDYDEADASLFDEFKNEFLEMYEKNDFALLDEKLNAVLQILNPKTKEGFILSSLQAILQHYEINSNEYKEIIKLAFEKLGWDKESKDNENKKNIIDEKAVKNALNILNTQLRVLEVSKDENLLERTKLILNNTLNFLGFNENLESINSTNELKEFIKEKIAHLNNKEKEINEDKIETKEIKKEIKEKKAAPTHISKTVKIEQGEIDELMDIVGELLVMKNALPYIAEQILKEPAERVRRELLSKYEQISRVTDRLQDKIMGMRLLPLSYIFNRYPKLVRDLSKKLNKKIKYVEEGAETKLDKTVIEKLADPMIHIIRNSIDHGLEDEQTRIALGKSPEGTLKVSAKSEGDKVFITVEDDGRGINVDKVVQKALEKNLINPDEIDLMSKEEKLKLIFLPGLSTKDEITDLSGRGVGADAVKNVVEELGGNIYVESETNKGTKITIELPLSVALTNVFHIKMNNVNYAIPMDYVVETEKIEKENIKTAAHKPFIRLRDELIPVVIEKNLLNRNYLKKENLLVIIQNKNQKFALAVDEFVGQLNVVQKPLTGAFANHPFISGTSLLGNGEVLFVIDPKKLIKDEK